MDHNRSVMAAFRADREAPLYLGGDKLLGILTYRAERSMDWFNGRKVGPKMFLKSVLMAKYQKKKKENLYSLTL